MFGWSKTFVGCAIGMAATAAASGCGGIVDLDVSDAAVLGLALDGGGAAEGDGGTASSTSDGAPARDGDAGDPSTADGGASVDDAETPRPNADDGGTPPGPGRTDGGRPPAPSGDGGVRPGKNDAGLPASLTCTSAAGCASGEQCCVTLGSAGPASSCAATCKGGVAACESDADCAAGKTCQTTPIALKVCRATKGAGQ